MASGPIISWELDGETVEILSQNFIFGGFKITADGDCSHEIKRRLLLGRKVMSNLDSLFQSRDITLPANVRLVKVLAFSAGSWKKQESSRKTSISALLTMPKPLTVWITINSGKC